MMDGTSCLALFDVVFHWLELCADYENASTQRHHSGLNTDNFFKSKEGGDRIQKALILLE